MPLPILAPLVRTRTKHELLAAGLPDWATCKALGASIKPSKAAGLERDHQSRRTGPAPVSRSPRLGLDVDRGRPDRYLTESARRWGAIAPVAPRPMPLRRHA